MHLDGVHARCKIFLVVEFGRLALYIVPLTILYYIDLQLVDHSNYFVIEPEHFYLKLTDNHMVLQDEFAFARNKAKESIGPIIPLLDLESKGKLIEFENAIQMRLELQVLP